MWPAETPREQVTGTGSCGGRREEPRAGSEPRDPGCEHGRGVRVRQRRGRRGTGVAEGPGGRRAEQHGECWPRRAHKCLSRPLCGGCLRGRREAGGGWARLEEAGEAFGPHRAAPARAWPLWVDAGSRPVGRLCPCVQGRASWRPFEQSGDFGPAREPASHVGAAVQSSWAQAPVRCAMLTAA